MWIYILNAGRFYPGRNSLVKKGLVQKDKVDGRTKAYTLTDRNRRELTARCEWMDQSLGGIAGEWTESA
ncbi:helix-turn-helix transcriptional regulator [Halalkalicoccus paucihalophilus]|uniref:helix-turn-helix transcriptional regulator n=1 Tax=Halalkalicoccus paucihalophilus TaxID=1008153 RepID=UPI000A07AE07